MEEPMKKQNESKSSKKDGLKQKNYNILMKFVQAYINQEMCRDSKKCEHVFDIDTQQTRSADECATTKQKCKNCQEMVINKK